MPKRNPHEWGADHDAHALLCWLRDDKGALAKELGVSLRTEQACNQTVRGQVRGRVGSGS
jgi:hypothetical protein